MTSHAAPSDRAPDADLLLHAVAAALAAPESVRLTSGPYQPEQFFDLWEAVMAAALVVGQFDSTAR